MKRKIFYIIFALAVITFSSCSKDDSTDTRITYYPTITLTGDSYLSWNKGETFVDPGYKCVLNGEDVTNKVTVNTNMDVNTKGLYKVSYSFTNPDGFSSTLVRNVCVVDKNEAVEGLYYVDPTLSNRSGTAYSSFGKDMYIEVYKDGDKYKVTDLIGGFYDQGRAYGSDYAMSGHVEVAADGTMSLLDSEIPGFGGDVTTFSGKFDSASHTISMQVVWSDMTFNVSLIKK